MTKREKGKRDKSDARASERRKERKKLKRERVTGKIEKSEKGKCEGSRK